jgi:protein-S-isoprenylcysteine O-methyltransferase Ste14
MGLRLLILSFFFILYAVLHSLLASLPVKAWVRRVFGPAANRWYRLVYNGVAVLTLVPLFPLLALWPDQTLSSVPAPWRWLMVGGQILALVGLLVSFWQFDPFYFVGLTQLVARQPAESGSLKVVGLHRWMRHPLYSFSMLFLWLTPVMSVNLLTLYLLCTLYFYIGSIHEENRLTAEFGQAYRNYQSCVFRFIPWPGRCYNDAKHPH